MRTVLVTDAARGSAVAAIRSFGRAGWRVVAADPKRTAPGLFSRHTARRRRYPDPRRDPSGAAEAVIRIVEREHVDLVFPVTDDVILPLLERRADLERVAVVALPGSGLLRTAADKGAVVALAEQHGVRAPRTVVWDPTSPAPVPEGLGWPVVVKPVSSRTLGAGRTVVAHDVSYARDRADLERTLAAAASPLLLQEYVRGDGHGVEVLARDGEVLVAFQHRRIREYPPSGGASSLREAVPVRDDLLDAARRLMAAMGWTGLAMVEFKVADDGTPHLMEINGRVWGSLPLAVAAGVDFPTLAAAVHLGEEPDLPVTPRLGTRSRNVELELRWAAAVVGRHRLGDRVPAPTRADALRVVADLVLVPSDGYDVLDRRDPLPGAVDTIQAVARTAVRSVRR